ncbi:protein vav [Agrilus planipennis]|uniref:Protein vav n=1 Tax=Agrilus planipennis TaxID=224129 RepID=A0A1W4WHB6_AGRPL|nr:protein vav [Agrilus planipennis]XP_018323325.1 protein vav [Agrilus planipennis]XP_018323326.1 protein vav [Agrilus planipennis]XP_018323327.1 protein vav [Agrilus planipennis]
MAEACMNKDELWRECASWLTRWDVLRSDHRVNWSTADIIDLANILRDGVILCTLLSKMDPGCIDMKDVNLKPAMAQFLCVRNIQTFLKICVASFGIKESDLFEPLMLFDLTDFHKVLCTLSKLSLTPKSQQSSIRGFSGQSLRRKDEDVYHNLKFIDPPSRIDLNMDQFDYHDNYHKEEEIYHDLCLLQNVTARQELSIQAPLEKRDFVIKELIETEHNYVEVINKLKKNFMRPLQTILSADVHSTIFCKINELHEIHTGFLSQLLKVGIDKSVKLSNIFMNWRERFLVYGPYCANLSNACALLQESCDKNEVVNMEVCRCENEDNNGKFKLRDVLSVPMQRILKYHLLLEKLIDLTDPNHEEYKDLKRAREAMLDVAGYINETARDSEHLAVIKKVQENLIEWDRSSEIKLENCGRLIKDGELKVKAHDDQKTRNRYVFIFDKVLILCKQVKGNQFAYRGSLHLPDFRLDDYNNRPILNREAKWVYQWHLVKNDQSTVYTLYARSIEIKRKMMKALRDAIDNVQPSALAKTNHKFEMHSFDKPITCNRCSKYLKGLIFQGYRCKTCDIAVHKECIAGSGRCGAPPPLPPPTLHCDAQLMDKLWFAGDMDRNEAAAILEHRRNGTYLVRIRSQRDDADNFALTLKTDNAVKHMKICCSVVGSVKKYYLSISKYFNSIEELIENYQHSSLKENFERLEENTYLEWPYRQLRAVAVRSFSSDCPDHLSFEQGQNIVVVGQEGYQEGWWKGKRDNMIGYFPKYCIQVLESVTREI